MKKLRYALLILFCCVACLTCPKDNDTPAWENISQTERDSYTPTIAADDNGNVYVVWADSTPGNAEILFAEKYANGIWSEPSNISNSPSIDVVPFIDIDGFGNLHTCWWQIESGVPDARILYRMRDAAGVWQDSRILAQTTSSDSEYALPRIICDSNSNVFVVWEAVGTLRYVYQAPGDTWSDILTIPNSSAGNPAELATDPQSNLHIGWPGGSDQIKYQMRTSDGTWQDYTVVDDHTSFPFGKDITTDGAGNAYITWDKNYGGNGRYVYYATNKSGTWSERIELPRVRDSDEGAQCACAAEEDGTLHLIWRNWRRDTPEYVAAEIHYAKQYPDDTWSNIHNISNTNSESTCGVRGIALDGYGNAHIVWSDHEPGNYDILYIMIPADSLN